MEHVVFFPAQDGTPAFRRFAGIEDAVRFVEHLRNVENVGGASVYSLTEVPLSFKAWYRVELPGTEGEAGQPAPEASASDTSSDVEIPAPAAVTVPAAVAMPMTVAETIESYNADRGSVTGIVVPDQPLVAVDQFGAPAPIGFVTERTPQPESEPAGQGQGQGQVLEPSFGARRDRGIGFFAR
ncbi:MAG: hypothetical protein ACRDV3_08280 [Acidothermaceae bacterium]